MPKKSLRIIAATAALLLALGSPVLADDEREGWWPGRGMGFMMGYGRDNMLERLDGRLAFLKAELKITEAQTPQWDDLAKTVKTTSETRSDMMREHRKKMHSGDFFEKPLPERLAYQEVFLEARLNQVKGMKGAVDKLYAVLDDKQKKSADEVVLPMMGMGCGRGCGKGRGMGWRWMMH